MLCGNIGREGVGVNPLRGQNNVQGACDMGAYPNVYSGYQKCEVPENRAKMEKAWGVTDLPGLVRGSRSPSRSTECGEEIKALYMLGINPAVTYPDSNHVKRQLEKLDFLVVQDISSPRHASMPMSSCQGACFAREGWDIHQCRTPCRTVSARQLTPPAQAKEDILDHCRTGQSGWA